MEILIISPTLYPDHIGGGEMFNYNIVQYLKMHHAVSVFTSAKSGISGVKKYQIKKILSTKLSYLLNLSYTLFKERNVNDIVFVSHTDDIHWLYYIMFPIFKKVFGLKYFVILYSGRFIEWDFPFPHRLFFRNANVVVSLDENVQHHYQKITKSKIQYLAQSCDLFINIEKRSKSELKAAFNIDQEQRIVLFFSRFHPIKSPETLLNAINYFDEEYLVKNKVVFWFCGAGDYLNTFVRNLNAKPELSKFVKVWGRVSEEDKIAIYKMSDIFVQTSLSEGSPPITLEEAMKNGIPTISTRIKEISSHYEEDVNILLFQIQNPKELSEKIKMLLENPQIAQKIGENAKSAYEKLASNTSMFFDIEKYLNEAANL